MMGNTHDRRCFGLAPSTNTFEQLMNTVVFVNEDDGRRLGLVEGQRVDVEGLPIDDGQTRWLRGFEVRWLAIAPGCAAAYFPEATPLVPLGLVAQGARTPAAKALPIRLHAATA